MCFKRRSYRFSTELSTSADRIKPLSALLLYALMLSFRPIGRISGTYSIISADSLGGARRINNKSAKGRIQNDG